MFSCCIVDQLGINCLLLLKTLKRGEDAVPETTLRILFLILYLLSCFVKAMIFQLKVICTG
jgi:hypothetical protein